MRVQRVLMPVLGSSPGRCSAMTMSRSSRSSGSWPTWPAIERSPNTVKAYAHDLKDWFTFLGGRGLDWRSVTLEDVAGFVGVAAAAAGGP